MSSNNDYGRIVTNKSYANGAEKKAEPDGFYTRINKIKTYTFSIVEMGPLLISNESIV